MKSFFIPISGLVAVGCTATSVSFAQETKNTVNENQGKDKTVAEFYGGVQYKQKENSTSDDGDFNTTTITQTTKIVKEEQPKGWWGNLQKVKTITLGILAYIGYTAFAVSGVTLAAETVGLTKFAENKLGIDKSVAQATVIGSGILGATAAVAEYLMK